MYENVCMHVSMQATFYSWADVISIIMTIDYFSLCLGCCNDILDNLELYFKEREKNLYGEH